MTRTSSQPGTLFVVATPIGNLSDLTERAKETLSRVAHAACEDTRHSRILFDRLGAHPRLWSLPAFDEKGRLGPLIELLTGGEDLALVTDAGTPAISDPGGALVAAAVQAGVPVVPIPGPSAVAAAISASGLAADRFCFVGFLPRHGTGRARLLEQLRPLSMAVVLYEAPNRLKETLVDLERVWGPRRALVARELTKVHEELLRGTLGELAGRLPEEVRGEIVLVVEGAAEAEEVVLTEEAIDAELRRLLGDKDRSVKDVSAQLAEQLGLPKKDLYKRALQLLGKQ